MEQRRGNRHLWAGIVLCILGLLSYFLLFVRFPVTRDVPWANFIILAAGLLFLASGLRRAFGQAQHYRGKITGPILGVLSLAAVGFFCFLIFFATKQLPKSASAPRVGQKAPDFVLTDSNNKEVTLASLMAAPLPTTQAAPKGVLLIFYRGYW